VVILALILGVAEPAGALVIDFENLAVGPIAGDTITLNVGGVDVTFSGAGLQVRQYGIEHPTSPFPTTKVLSTTLDVRPITITFQSGFSANYVEVENIVNGTYTPEVDVIVGTAYDVDSAVLDSQTNSNTIHHLTGPGIVRVVYDDDPHGEGYVLDNFSFVPEPSSLTLLGMAGLGWTGRAILLRRREETRAGRHRSSLGS
jgi:hypothetical protein